MYYVFFFQAEDGIRDFHVTGVQTCALPILAKPADPGGQALERHPARCELEPSLEERIVREEVAEHCVDGRNVRRLTGERRPPKRTNAATEERPNIGRDEARV